MKKKSNKEKNEKNLTKTVSAMLELPKEIMLNLPLITIIGKEDLTVENYKGIIEYTDEKIRLKTSCGILKIEGKKLCLKEITSENIAISGTITKFEYIL